MITIVADNKQIPVEWIEFKDGALVRETTLHEIRKRIQEGL